MVHELKGWQALLMSLRQVVLGSLPSPDKARAPVETNIDAEPHVKPPWDRTAALASSMVTDQLLFRHSERVRHRAGSWHSDESAERGKGRPRDRERERERAREGERGSCKGCATNAPVDVIDVLCSQTHVHGTIRVFLAGSTSRTLVARALEVSTAARRGAPTVIAVKSIDVGVAEPALVSEDKVLHQPLSQALVAVVKEVLAARKALAAVADAREAFGGLSRAQRRRGLLARCRLEPRDVVHLRDRHRHLVLAGRHWGRRPVGGEPVGKQCVCVWSDTLYANSLGK